MIEDLAYDIGMNDGADTAYYLHKGFRVVAVEANPELVEAAQRRFRREIAAGRLMLRHVGVSDSTQPLPFWICDDHPEWSSFDRTYVERDGCAHHSISVPCRRFAEILDEYGTPFYMKIDIEGNDALCLRDLRGRELPKYISVEAGGLDNLTALHELGYSRFKCISQFHFVPLEIPPTPQQMRLEHLSRRLRSKSLGWRIVRGLGAKHWLRRRMKRTRRRDDWVFAWGSSGPFAEELPGRWQAFDEMCQTYEHYQQMRASGESSALWHEKDYSFWSDFHATRAAA